jgi:predicted extracellular nuclease
MVAGLGAGCRDDDDPNNPDAGLDVGMSDSDGQGPEGDGNGVATSTTIYEITDSTIAEGTKVLLPDVIVTAVDGYGEFSGDIYVQEAQGGAGSGLKLYRPTRLDGDIQDLQVGDHVKVEGTVKYFTQEFNDKNHPNKTHIKELDPVEVTKLNPGTPPAPEEVTAEELINDPTAEQWEGVLVQVKDVRITSEKDEYDEFYVSGGLKVADDFYPYNPTRGDCVSVTGISIYFYGYKLHPRSDADIVAATGCPQPQAVTIQDIQDPNSQDHPSEGTDVKVQGVITAVDTTLDDDDEYEGFWVQDGTGPYSGIYVYYHWKETSTNKPAVGDEVEVTGIYKEFYDVSEIGTAMFTKLGTGTVPQAEVVSAADVVTGGAKAEEYEGVLIKVENVTVSEYITDTAGTQEFGFTDTTTGLIVKADIYDFIAADKPALGTTFSSVTGPLHYSYGDFKLLPRNAADLVQ